MTRSLFFRGAAPEEAAALARSSPGPCLESRAATGTPTDPSAATGTRASSGGSSKKDVLILTAPAAAAATTSGSEDGDFGLGLISKCLPKRGGSGNPGGKPPFPISALPPALHYWWARLERAVGGPKRLRALLLASMTIKFLFGLALLYMTYAASGSPSPPNQQQQQATGGGGGKGGGAAAVAAGATEGEEMPLPYRLAGQGAKATGLAVGVISGSGQPQKRRVRLLQETWMTSLDPTEDALLVFSDKTDVNLPTVGLKGTGSTWAGAQDRFFPALAFLYRAFPNASWFMLVDDDTFLVPRNLKAALGKRDPAKRWYLGRTMFVDKQGQDKGKKGKTKGEEQKEQDKGKAKDGQELLPFAHGGSGVLFSKGLMAAFSPHLHTEAQDPTPECRRTGYGDGDLAVCLHHHLGVKVTHEPCLHSSGPWAAAKETTLDALVGGGVSSNDDAAPCSFHQALRRPGDASPGAGRADGGEDEQVRAWHREYNLGVVEGDEKRKKKA